MGVHIGIHTDPDPPPHQIMGQAKKVLIRVAMQLHLQITKHRRTERAAMGITTR